MKMILCKIFVGGQTKAMRICLLFFDRLFIGVTINTFISTWKCWAISKQIQIGKARNVRKDFLTWLLAQRFGIRAQRQSH
ncbi:hypothetical protein [Collimonas silvisoli]|uniref:hypothetical protein n=1 Tax=Collimonas silvisoli TaxID=2825884 RepID=UPI001B8BC087|nr:hypothetical protein [Collimonas silvisoli]